MAISSILVGVIGSVILLASHAIPDKQSSMRQAIEAQAALDRLAHELRYAIHLAEWSDRSVRFTVADRNGDHQPEIIAYAWSGTAGDPLTRSYNGGAAATLIDGVQDLDMTYLVETWAEPYDGPLEPQSGRTFSEAQTDGDVRSAELQHDFWLGQLISTPLDDDERRWLIESVELEAAAAGFSWQTIHVQIRTVDADGYPTDQVLQEETLTNSDLPGAGEDGDGDELNYNTLVVTFSDPAALMPGQRVALVLEHGGGLGRGGKYLYDEDVGSGMLNWDGSAWHFLAGSLLHRIRGSTLRTSTDRTVERRFVIEAEAALTVADGAKHTARTAARLDNAPEALADYWEADFQADPTQLDANADGVADWRQPSGSLLNLGNLIDTLLSPTEPLRTQPPSDFSGPTVAEVRFRTVATGGPDAAFTIHPDWDGNRQARLNAALELHGDGTQTLTLEHRVAPGDDQTLLRVNGLPSGWVDLRLLIDPDRDNCSVRVNGRDRGTYPYEIYTPSTPRRYAELRSERGDGQFDHVAIRVGGAP